MIVPFAGASAPSGWAICDGSELPIASYGQLYGRISTTWNNARNQSTGVNWANPTAGNFRLPDLRGTFLRAVGTSSGYGATTLAATQDDATATPTTPFTTASASISGTAAGQTFTGSSGSHGHTITDTASRTPRIQGFSVGGGSTGLYGGNLAGENLVVDSQSVTINHTHGSSAVTGTSAASTVNGGGDSETRPVNVGVNYLIKLYDDAGSIVMSGSPFVGSEFQPAPISITGNNTLAISKFYTIDSASASTQTLPAATGSNAVITVENTGTGLVTVDGNASETINGSLNQVIGQYASLKVRDYAPGKWIIMH
jgi:microcystin-dependent protein